MGLILTLFWSVLSVLVLPADAAEGADITGEHTKVFLKGEKENATAEPYACFRSPAVVKSKGGALLTFAEGRIGDCGDSGRIDIVAKRSVDGGVTWSSLKVVARHSSASGFPHNPVPIVDTTNSNADRVVLLYSWSYDHVYRLVSADGGLTWDAAKDISTTVWPSDKPDWGTWPNGQMSVGPGHGIQLTKGAKAGRMVAGLWIRKAPGTKGTPMGVGLIYSDNSGADWKLGAHSLGAEPLIGAQEPSLFERADGSIVVVARNEEGTAATNRTAYAISSDQGQSFGEELRLLPELGLPAIGVQTSTLAIPQEGREGYGRVLLAAPADPTTRKNLTIRSSFDGGLTWQSPAQGSVVREGLSAYSDMVAMDAGRYGIVYEGGEEASYQFVSFATFTEADLDGQPANADALTGSQHTGALATGDPAQLHLFAPTTTGGLGNWYESSDGTVKQSIWGTGATGETVSFGYGSQQHVLVRATDGNLLHRFWDAGSGTLHQQTWAEPGAVAGAPTAIVTPGQQHAFVRATNGGLLHIWWDAGSGELNRQSWAADGTLAGDPVAVVYGDQQHVWAAGSDGRLHHWWWTKGIGVRHEIWTGSAKGTPTAFVYRGQQHVYASDGQGVLTHWWWDHGTRAVKKETLPVPAPSAERLAGRPVAFVHGTQQHIFARTTDDRLAHWWWDPTAKNKFAVWPGSVHSDPVAHSVDGTQHVYGASVDGTLTHWWWNTTDGVRQEDWGGQIPKTGRW
ncbi:exo-alpha-sialidase [Streptomyces sp. NPDC047971]|uniref:exo-alpha-sialidase n=1 Tax=Streptomyces sp. NPDC047971 TaxID=3154499 RepID=UPI0034030D54